jgi:hypothetical protein
MRADPLLPAQAYARDVLGSPPRAPSPEHSAHSPIADYVAAQRRARRRLAEEAVQSRRAKDALANPNRRPPWVPAATAGVGALKIASPVNAAWPSAQPSARQQGRPGALQGITFLRLPPSRRAGCRNGPVASQRPRVGGCPTAVCTAVHARHVGCQCWRSHT